MTATVTVERKPKRTPVPLNGVDTPTLLATIKAVGAQPDLAKFRFRARNEWISGTHSRSTMSALGRERSDSMKDTCRVDTSALSARSS